VRAFPAPVEFRPAQNPFDHPRERQLTSTAPVTSSKLRIPYFPRGDRTDARPGMDPGRGLKPAALDKRVPDRKGEMMND
jgi:hypothetical protein